MAETNNITLSAKNLHMSQPCISLQIQNLENEYGVRFFDRTNKGVTLTKEGEIFYECVQSILAIIACFKEEMSTLAKDQRRLIYLGATLTIGEYILPNIMAYLYKTHPDLDFKVKIANTESIMQNVLDEKMHIGLIEGTFPQHKDLKVENFWDDELVVVIPQFHPWASRSRGRNSITLAELSNERLVIREEGSGTRELMKKVLKESGLDLNKLNITMELESIQAIKRVVSAGLGITVISSLTVSSAADQKIFKTLKIQDALVYRPFYILTNVRTSQTTDEHVLVNLLHDHKLLANILSKDFNESEEEKSKLSLTYPAVSSDGQEQRREQFLRH